MPHGIILLGPNGAGKSTLGRELARVLNFAHFDVEDYWFYKTDLPFTVIRPLEERNAMLLSDMKKHGSFVVSGDISDWSDEFLTMFDLAVFLTAPIDIRLKRIENREYARWGDRVRAGGDMYEQQQKFREFAATRNLALIEQQAAAYPCPLLHIDSTEDYHATAASIAERFYTKPGEPLRVTTHPLGELKTYRFTVIFAQYGKGSGGWLYARHKKRDTWETAGGHIEKGETPLNCAKRELREETGAKKFYIHPAFDYAVHMSTEFSYGQVFYAHVETLGELPPEFEMREVKTFPTIPDAMTFPQILPVLFTELQKWLGLVDKPDEYWDVLDGNRQPTGRTHKRSEPLPEDDYHIVVRAWIMNSKGEFLITRRAFNKIGFPGMWEIPGGSATAGEDSLTATIREAQEECGITLLPEKAELFSTYRRGNSFYDNWLFRQEFGLANVVLQEGETIDARAATWSEISAMMERGEYIGLDVFPEFGLLRNAFTQISHAPERQDNEVNKMMIEIKKLTPDLLDDYLGFFDTDAHADNPDPNEHGCYCVGWCTVDHRVATDFSSPEKRRALAAQYVSDGSIQGYLAYAGGKVVGWCNANTKSDCLNCISWLRFMPPVELAEEPETKVKSVFCFAIAPSMKRQGIATRLLERVCEDAAEEGFDFVEAYPNKEFVNEFRDFMGPLGLYQQFGFSVHEECEGKYKNCYVVRKPVR